MNKIVPPRRGLGGFASDHVQYAGAVLGPELADDGGPVGAERDVRHEEIAGDLGSAEAVVQELEYLPLLRVSREPPGRRARMRSRAEWR